MSSLAFFFVFACFATLVMATAAAPKYAPEDAEFHFERFIEDYARNYMDTEERETRFKIFKDNLEKANRMNEQSDHATFGITQFMDLTLEEFLNTYTCLRIPGPNMTSFCNHITDDQIPDAGAPDFLDWRQSNVVTRVKNQQNCGGCYAFSSTGNIEGQYAIKYQQLTELSEQQIIDCDTSSHGCRDGYTTTAFMSIIQQGGIEPESSYPYDNAQQSCRFKPSNALVRLTGCNQYTIVSQEKMKQLLYSVGPISIAVKSTAFHGYNGGIMSDEFCDVGEVNHAVLLVGYGTENGKPYWLVKNSWGGWGEQGYFRMTRGEGASSCGMLEPTGLMASSIIQ